MKGPKKGQKSRPKQGKNDVLRQQHIDNKQVKNVQFASKIK